MIRRHVRGGTKIDDPFGLRWRCHIIQGEDESRLVPLCSSRRWSGWHLSGAKEVVYAD
jgi:hypothetical protein